MQKKGISQKHAQAPPHWPVVRCSFFFLSCFCYSSHRLHTFLTYEISATSRFRHRTGPSRSSVDVSLLLLVVRVLLLLLQFSVSRRCWWCRKLMPSHNWCKITQHFFEFVLVIVCGSTAAAIMHLH